MSTSLTLLWTSRLIAFAVLLQNIEFWQIRRVCTDHGLWSWAILSDDFAAWPKPLRKILSQCLRWPNFQTVLFFRLLGSLELFVDPTWPCFLLLFLCSLLINWRWRGAFNGGSDMMTTLILFALTVATWPGHPEWLMSAGLLFIGVEACLSYAIAGFAKIRNPHWRSGQALQTILQRSHYPVPEMIRRLAQHKEFCLVAAWLTLLLECLSPLALLSPTSCLLFIAFALLFHFCNACFLGLNRFFFAWIAAYPALYYASQAHR